MRRRTDLVCEGLVVSLSVLCNVLTLWYLYLDKNLVKCLVISHNAILPSVPADKNIQCLTSFLVMNVWTIFKTQWILADDSEIVDTTCQTENSSSEKNSDVYEEENRLGEPLFVISSHQSGINGISCRYSLKCISYLTFTYICYEISVEPFYECSFFTLIFNNEKMRIQCFRKWRLTFENRRQY
jgi:hypothetical protein